MTEVDSAATEEFDLRVERREAPPVCLADAAAVGLDALRKVRSLRLGDPAPPARLEAAARFVVIEQA
jgi:hypothetical protein